MRAFSDKLASRAIEAFTEGKDRTLRLLQRLAEGGDKLDAEIRSAATAGLNAANREYDSLIQEIKATAGATTIKRAYKRNYDRTAALSSAAEMAGAAEPVKKKRSKMSAQARRAISLAQKKRWAKQKNGHAKQAASSKK